MSSGCGAEASNAAPGPSPINGPPHTEAPNVATAKAEKPSWEEGFSIENLAALSVCYRRTSSLSP